MTYEKEICPGWIYTGPGARALGTVAARRADEVDRARLSYLFYPFLQIGLVITL